MHHDVLCKHSSETTENNLEGAMNVRTCRQISKI